MLAFIVRRLIYSVVVVVGVSIIVFILTHAIGDPAKLMLPLEATQAQYEAFRQQMGFNDPLPVQFMRFASAAIHGDFGESLWQQVPALPLVLDRLPATFIVIFSGMALSILISLPLGIFAALRPRSLLDRFCTVISLLFISVPPFWLGMMLIIIFAVNLHWLPTSGYYDEPKYVILPALTTAALPLGRITQIVRSSMIDELGKQYPMTAESKGIAASMILLRHVLKNAAIPIVTLSAWEFIRLLAGYTVVVETVFAWPGVGYLAMQAIQNHDMPLIQADVFVVALMVVAVNFFTDAFYVYLDPRIRLA